MPSQANKMIEDSDTMHYVSERNKRGREEVKMQPPLTPMIDVTFQLLLYFLLTSTFRKDEGQIPGSLPALSGIPPKMSKLKPIKIVLRPLGASRESVQYKVGRLAPVTNEIELQRLLLSAQKRVGTDEVPIIIQSNGGVRWKYVVNVFNAAVVAKFKNIGFAQAG